MASPSGRRRPLSTSGYEPLIPQSGDKPKPPPKPKPQFLKAFSTTALGTSVGAEVQDHDDSSKESNTSSSSAAAVGGYFQPGGASGIGYCLSSVYKPKKTTSESGDVKSEVLPKPRDSKPKFASKVDGSRPSLISLPAKFRFSFEERNRQCVPKADTEPATGVLIPISESGAGVIRRTPPPVPRNNKNRMSLPLAADVSRSLPIELLRGGDKLLRTSSLKGNSVTTHTSTVPVDTQTSTVPVSAHNSTLSTSTHSLSSTGSMSAVSPTATTPSPVPSYTSKPVTFAQPPPFEMEHVDGRHPQNAFEYLEKFRYSGELCDATFLVGDKELKAHRVVLAACSQFFESMFIGEFAEPADEPVVIEELSENILEMMITFAYTSRIKLTEKNVYSVFEAADLLQFTGVKGACFKFFKQQINKSNCMRTWLFAESHNCIELLEASLRYIDYNFLDIVRGKEFLDTDQPSTICGIICREDLVITSEEQVYEAVMSWVQRDVENRRTCALEVFKNVRFSSMSRDYLMHIVDNEPLMKEDPDLLQLVRTLASHGVVLAACDILS
jgi:hypothetical protein